ncbi:hypothetical protein [Kitasatospora paranensis]|uniref:hypothetical protein n=1 Tax=Kitasatospora paranensis TaxID=258053 RepID=UPI0031E89472
MQQITSRPRSFISWSALGKPITGEYGQILAFIEPVLRATSPRVSPKECTSVGPIRPIRGLRSPKWCRKIDAQLSVTCALLARTSRPSRGQGVARPVVPVVS